MGFFVKLPYVTAIPVKNLALGSRCSITPISSLPFVCLFKAVDKSCKKLDDFILYIPHLLFENLDVQQFGLCYDVIPRFGIFYDLRDNLPAE